MNYLLLIKFKYTLFTILWLFSFQFAIGQISPGDLVKAHAHLEGMSNCTKCHTLGKKVSNEKCLACHQEIKARIDQKKGYHASTEVRGKTCASCHNDHHGRNFQIIRFNTEKFNHNLTGYPLDGAHSGKACKDCHKPDFINDAKLKKNSGTFLGLKTECLGCHQDYHQGTLSASCIDCHDAKSFKPATKFDHTKTNFQLKGKHQQVLCVDCHKTSMKNGVKFQQFTDIGHGKCTDCHKDPHENKFGQNCAQCHSETSFKLLKTDNSFDHSKTNFKLKGLHKQVACEKCHKNGFTAPLSFSRCTDCHVDYHKGDFSRRDAGSDCADCHTEMGYTPSTFTVSRHNETSFQLFDAHLATPCIACHKKADAWKFSDMGNKCVDCHIDVHDKQITASYYPDKSCKTCHKETRWNTVVFDHSLTKFPLTDAHAIPDCRKCHLPLNGKSIADFRFAGLSDKCNDCHADIHGEQFAISSYTDCARCHDTKSFLPASRFDHGATRFPLDGKHNTVACSGCHKSRQDNQRIFTWYKIEKFKCEDCH
ncbi:MAG TPA: cytochrome C [Bacteroidales bacterium]|nr:cytochrome C [Bacteroidales bacterium]HBZ65484.1 cytochrome C [Bacteroidales bacterium]